MRQKERLHADIEYRTLNWKLRYWHNDADIYDLAGPALRSRKGDAVIISYEKAKIYDPPRQLDLFGSVAGYFGLEQLPSAQNIPSPKDIFSVEIGVRYTNTRQALGGVDHEKGIAWRVSAAPTMPRATPFHISGAGSTMASRCRCPTARPGSTRRPGSSAASRRARSALIISAASATTMSITGRRSATASWRASPGSTSTRSRRAGSPS